MCVYVCVLVCVCACVCVYARVCLCNETSFLCVDVYCVASLDAHVAPEIFQNRDMRTIAELNKLAQAHVYAHTQTQVCTHITHAQSRAACTIISIAHTHAHAHAQHTCTHMHTHAHTCTHTHVQHAAQEPPRRSLSTPADAPEHTHVQDAQ